MSHRKLYPIAILLAYFGTNASSQETPLLPCCEFGQAEGLSLYRTSNAKPWNNGQCNDPVEVPILCIECVNRTRDYQLCGDAIGSKYTPVTFGENYPRYYAVVSPIGGSPSSLSFRAYQGGSNPASQTLSVSNNVYARWAIDYDLSWIASESLDWLSLSVTSGHSYGTTPTTTVASVNVAGKSAGTYSGNIVFSSSMVSSLQNTSIPATLTIANLPTITIAGSTYLQPGQTGYWSASVSGGFSPYHYQWYYFPVCNRLAGPPQPLLPPCGDWYTCGADQPSLSASYSSDFKVKCVLTDALGTVRTSNEVYVSVGGALSKSLASADSPMNAETSLDPSVFSFAEAYPNPFNPSTTLVYNLPEASSVKLCILDVLGREVTVLDEGTKDAGTHRLVWHGNDSWGETVAAGVYFARLVSQRLNGNLIESRMNKLLLVK